MTLNRVRALIAWDADLADHPTTWDWSDTADPATRPEGTTGRLFVDRALSITSGRANETTQPQPARGAGGFDNRDYQLTPRNPRSRWWRRQGWRGTPIRYDIHAGTPQLQLDGTGSRASTPDHAALDVAAPFLAVELGGPVWLPPADQGYQITGRWDATINQRSVIMWWGDTGRIRLRWSEDGTAATQKESLAPGRPIPITGGITLASWLDPDDGAGGHTVTWWAARRLDHILNDPDAYQIGATTGVGTTSVHAGTAPFQAGDIQGSVFTPYPGLVRRIYLADGGPAAAPVADLDISTLEEGVTGTTDSAGRVWAFTNAEVTRWKPLRTLRCDRWLPDRPHGNIDGLARVDIEGAGVLRRLNSGRARKPLGSALRRRILARSVAANVLAYWPCEDENGAASLASAIPGVPAIGFGGLQPATDATLAASMALPTAAGGQGYGWRVTVPVFSGVTDWRFDQFARINTPATSPAETLLFQIETTGTVRRWTFSINNVAVIVRGFDASDTEITGEGVSTIPGDFGQWTRWGLRIRQSGGNIEWTASYVHVGGGFTGHIETVAGTVGRVTAIGALTTAPPAGISFGQKVLTTGLPAEWLEDTSNTNGAGTAFVGERAGRRWLRLCEEENLPARVQGDPDATPAMGPQLPGKPLIGLLEDCVAADLGMAVELPHEFGVGYRTRQSLYNQHPSLTVNAQGDEVVKSALIPVDDDGTLINDVTVSRPAGSSARVVDQDSIDTEDLYDEQFEVNLATDLQLGGNASWRVHRATVAEPRYERVPIQLDKIADTNPDLVEQVLDTGPGDLVHVDGLDDGHATPTIDVIVEGDTTSLEPVGWVTTLNTSPAAPYRVAVRDRDRRGSSTSTVAADFDAGTDTSLSVAVASGLLWTTDPANLPFDLDVDGAQVTVTAISGAGSPQTFTVTTVNGVTRTIPAGTPVRLWQQPVRG